ncbi:MAG: NnrU family protein [Proteobacteria bacterium]|nr:NnrU family protein [Pseudomonadota bacterium]
MRGTLGEVALAALVFVGSHVLLSGTLLRGALAKRLSEGGFLVLYSAVAAATLIWLIIAYRDAPYVELWPTAAWARYLPLVVMPFASVLVVCAATTRNPTMVGGEMLGTDGDPAPGIMKVTRYPFMWSVVLWAAAHMVPNGDAATVILFSSLLALALAGMALIDRKRQRQGGAWRPIALTTSVVPFAAILAGRTHLTVAQIGWWRIAAGLALYAALLLAHGPVIGVRALPG